MERSQKEKKKEGRIKRRGFFNIMHLKSPKSNIYLSKYLVNVEILNHREVVAHVSFETSICSENVQVVDSDNGLHESYEKQSGKVQFISITHNQ